MRTLLTKSGGHSSQGLACASCTVRTGSTRLGSTTSASHGRLVCFLSGVLGGASVGSCGAKNKKDQESLCGRGW